MYEPSSNRNRLVLEAKSLSLVAILALGVSACRSTADGSSSSGSGGGGSVCSVDMESTANFNILVPIDQATGPDSLATLLGYQGSTAQKKGWSNITDKVNSALVKEKFPPGTRLKIGGEVGYAEGTAQSDARNVAQHKVQELVDDAGEYATYKLTQAGKSYKYQIDTYGMQVLQTSSQQAAALSIKAVDLCIPQTV